MAEYCLTCFNSIHHTAYRENEVTLADDYCEGCGQWKACVAATLPPSILARAKRLIQTWLGKPDGNDKPHIIKTRRGAVKVTRHGQLLSVEPLPLDMQTAYVRVSGAAGAALDELCDLPAHQQPPEVKNAIRILETALKETDGLVQFAENDF